MSLVAASIFDMSGAWLLDREKVEACSNIISVLKQVVMGSDDQL